MAYNIWETCVLMPGFNRSECASWVQAIGTLVALAIAVAVPAWQHWAAVKREQRSDAQRAKRVLEIALVLARMGRDRVAEFLEFRSNPEKLEDRGAREAFRHMLKTALHDLEELKALDMPTVPAAKSVAALQQWMVTAIAAVGPELPNGPGRRGSPALGEELRPILSNCANCVRVLEEESGKINVVS